MSRTREINLKFIRLMLLKEQGIRPDEDDMTTLIALIEDHIQAEEEDIYERENKSK